NDIWFQGLLHWDGQTFTLHKENFPLLPNGDGWRMHGTWGTSGSDFYVVGDQGMIAHYDGSSWTKIESATDVSIQDIFGVYNVERGDYEILAVASVPFKSYEIALLSIKDNIATNLQAGITQAFLSSVWFSANGPYFLSGNGIYHKKSAVSGRKWQRYPNGKVTSYYTHEIRGTAYNNIFACGAFGEIVHFNGADWYNYLSEMRSFGRYIALDVSEKKVVIGGEGANNAGILLLGTPRN
ncbi:MAG: hypothetical protein D6677_00570, partial [Calditrichaeota bacterium]